MSRLGVAVAAIGILALTVSCAGPHDVDELELGFRDVGEPIAELPSHVTAPAGQLTLFADFAHRGQTVPVYLVNRTGAPVALEVQDGAFYLKLEYQDESGRWQRAQPHAYSWCGNSHDDRRLAQDSFLRIEGHRYTQGKEAKVRYRLYRSRFSQPGREVVILSKVGTGIVDPMAIEKAANDAMAVSHGDFEFVKRVAMGTQVLHNEMDHVKDLREHALYHLAETWFDHPEAEAVLGQVAAGDDPKYAEMAADALNVLAAQRQRAQQDAGNPDTVVAPSFIPEMTPDMAERFQAILADPPD